MMLLRIHEKHSDDDAIKHTDGGHCGAPDEPEISLNCILLIDLLMIVHSLNPVISGNDKSVA